MTEILQDAMPEAMRGPVGLPGVAPCAAEDWLRVDEAYAGQMAERERLLAEAREAVLWLDPAARVAAEEVLAEASALLPGLGFRREGDGWLCPDGRRVVPDAGDPLGTLGRLVQQDICILEKRGEEHVLTGAVLCFPASWMLSEKAGRPLVSIHAPVVPYDADLARRVQRLFDGVRPGRPLWRFNRLFYADATLHQPRSETARRTVTGLTAETAPYMRSERQCIVRMPVSGAVVFAIHTMVVRNPGRA